MEAEYLSRCEEVADSPTLLVLPQRPPVQVWPYRLPEDLGVSAQVEGGHGYPSLHV